MMDLPQKTWALNSAVECHPHTVEVVGSNPTAPTISFFCEPCMTDHPEAQLAPKTGMDAEQWSEELHAWVDGHSGSTPLLSDEAISRDSIYGTRGL
jgi:hypothetical protein